MAYDAAGNLYIADSNNNMIRYVPAANGSYDGKAVKAGDIYTIVGKGPAGDSGDGGAAASAELNYPAGIVVGSSGRLLISDSGNNTIRQVVPPAPGISGVKPTSGPIAGGKKVTIKGVNLESVSAVYFGSQHGGELHHPQRRQDRGRVARSVTRHGGHPGGLPGRHEHHRGQHLHVRGDGGQEAQPSALTSRADVSD